MKVVIIREGKTVIDDIPVSSIDSGMVLVKVSHSCISAGTELQGVQNSANSPLWKRALDNPEKVLEIAQKVKTKGLGFARNFVEAKLAGSEAGRPTGYSASGIIYKVGTDITDLQPGQRVACAGSQYAFHAEFIAVPRNLVVTVPDNVELHEAATVTLGAIALQGLRRVHPTLGETIVVIGLGILGQLTAQMLKANGCYVIGIDLDDSRIKKALSLGMDVGIHPNTTDAFELTSKLTAGHGADGVIITAATKSDEVISTAFKLCRRKGRVVLVGDIGLNLNRSDFYEKELDFFISTSYGPGRYDRRYEEDGLDYPIGYVRWTENRNMSEFLRLIANKRIQVAPLISNQFPIDEAPTAFASFNGEKRPLIVLLKYNMDSEPQYIIPNQQARSLHDGLIRLGIVGAGSFTQTTHLPNLRLLKSLYYLHTVVTRSGEKSAKIARQYQFKQASTDFKTMISDKDIDAVVIATRHNQHASMLLTALKAGKHVLVEKPTVINQTELKELHEYATQIPTPILMTGYNRRFSPHIQHIHDYLQKHCNGSPMMINYHMNVEYIPLDHWIYSPEGAGRNIGEACHIYDLFVLLTKSKATHVQVACASTKSDYYKNQDNFVTTIKFANGSVCSLTYTSIGNRNYSKETMHLFCDGCVITMNDYKTTQIFDDNPSEFNTLDQEKGNKEILASFAQTIQKGIVSPMSIEDQLEVMRIVFEVEGQLNE